VGKWSFTPCRLCLTALIVGAFCIGAGLFEPGAGELELTSASSSISRGPIHTNGEPDLAIDPMGRVFTAAQPVPAHRGARGSARWTAVHTFR